MVGRRFEKVVSFVGLRVCRNDCAEGAGVSDCGRGGGMRELGSEGEGVLKCGIELK